MRAQIRSQLPRHVHLSATHKPWCERPHPSRRGATLRARRRGRSHHGLSTGDGRRGVQTGGKRHRPIAGDGRDYLRSCWKLARKASAAVGRVVRDQRAECRQQLGTTYAVARSSPCSSGFSTSERVPTSGVNCRYWCGSWTNSTRPQPRCIVSRSRGNCMARSAS